MSVQDFPFKCHNASVEATASTVWCLPPEEVVDDRHMPFMVHDDQVRPFRCSVGDDRVRICGVLPKVLQSGRVVCAHTGPPGVGFCGPRVRCHPGR
jgi:hypothetical protein